MRQRVQARRAEEAAQAAQAAARDAAKRSAASVGKTPAADAKAAPKGTDGKGDATPLRREIGTLAAEAMPDGEAWYREQIRKYTTLDLSADEIHAIGVKEVASHITPVPGGVGPMTIAVLLRNTLVAAHGHAGLAPPEGL